MYRNGMGRHKTRQYNKDKYGNPSPNGGYGKGLKEDIRKMWGSTVGISGRGECIARYDNYCEIDPNVVDQYGIPVLGFNYTWSDNEILQDRKSTRLNSTNVAIV